jgi:hypothetical protein
MAVSGSVVTIRGNGHQKIAVYGRDVPAGWHVQPLERFPLGCRKDLQGLLCLELIFPFVAWSVQLGCSPPVPAFAGTYGLPQPELMRIRNGFHPLAIIINGICLCSLVLSQVEPR